MPKVEVKRRGNILLGHLGAFLDEVPEVVAKHLKSDDCPVKPEDVRIQTIELDPELDTELEVHVKAYFSEMRHVDFGERATQIREELAQLLPRGSYKCRIRVYLREEDGGDIVSPPLDLDLGGEE